MLNAIAVVVWPWFAPELLLADNDGDVGVENEDEDELDEMEDSDTGVFVPGIGNY